MREKRSRVCGDCGSPVTRRAVLCRSCWMSRRMTGLRGPDHPAWVGDAASVQGFRERARKMRPLGAPCETAGCENEANHRHHRDGHVANNSPSNLAVLCATCHERLHAQSRSRDDAGRFLPMGGLR